MVIGTHLVKNCRAGRYWPATRFSGLRPTRYRSKSCHIRTERCFVRHRCVEPQPGRISQQVLLNFRNDLHSRPARYGNSLYRSNSPICDWFNAQIAASMRKCGILRPGHRARPWLGPAHRGADAIGLRTGPEAGAALGHRRPSIAIRPRPERRLWSRPIGGGSSACRR